MARQTSYCGSGGDCRGGGQPTAGKLLAAAATAPVDTALPTYRGSRRSSDTSMTSSVRACNMSHPHAAQSLMPHRAGCRAALLCALSALINILQQSVASHWILCCTALAELVTHSCTSRSVYMVELQCRPGVLRCFFSQRHRRRRNARRTSLAATSAWLGRRAAVRRRGGA